MSTKTLILEHKAILQKMKRLAWQVYENNYRSEEIVLVGIKERGKVVSDLLASELKSISDLKIQHTYMELNADSPLDSKFDDTGIDFNNKIVVLVDDVLNTGKTLMLATVPILLQNPAALQTVILANRDHKKFAISADYVGISLATTLHEHISFSLNQQGEYEVSLS